MNENTCNGKDHNFPSTTLATSNNSESKLVGSKLNLFLYNKPEHKVIPLDVHVHIWKKKYDTEVFEGIKELLFRFLLKTAFQLCASPSLTPLSSYSTYLTALSYSAQGLTADRRFQISCIVLLCPIKRVCSLEVLIT